MKIHPFSAMGMLSLAMAMSVSAKPKTITSEKINPKDISETPFRFNGLISTGDARGSGFCAWNKRAYFSAAHVVFGEGWGAPPTWYGALNSSSLLPTDAIQTRGYYRWTDYAEYVAESGSTGAAFGKDVILGFAFTDLINGKPASINLQGGSDLVKGVKTTITGYPARDPYKDKPIAGYFLHRTPPAVTPFKSYADRALYTSLITTGPGNSGGPIWSKKGKNGWAAAGVLVGGRPSETIVYAFSNQINSLIRAVEPVVSKNPSGAIGVNGVGASSMFFPYNKDFKIPDGSHKWTNFRVGVKSFEQDSTVTAVRLSLDIRTKHRGDLTIMLASPGGIEVLVHNEEGADKDDLIIEDMDFSESFTDVDPNGTWILRVQDRLKGDACVLKSFRLEIAADPAETTEPTP
jgi:subtilisin-like proprotein convertase family protein